MQDIRNHTLSSIAEGMGREKRTAQAWYTRAKSEHGELGQIVDGCRYFSDHERAILVGYAGADRPQSTKKDAAAAVPENFIQPSALVPVQVVETDLPEGFDPSAMVRFFDGVAGQGTDTTKLLTVAKQVLTAVSTVMDSKIEQQRQKLNQAEQDGAELTELIAETKTSLQIKALESRILAERQTAVTTQSQKAFNELMAMGKPTDG